jgi:hypothetical protein
MPWQIGDTCSDVVRPAGIAVRGVSPAIRFNRSISAITKVFARGKAAKMVVGSIMAWSAFGNIVNSGVGVPPIPTSETAPLARSYLHGGSRHLNLFSPELGARATPLRIRNLFEPCDS